MDAVYMRPIFRRVFIQAVLHGVVLRSITCDSAQTADVTRLEEAAVAVLYDCVFVCENRFQDKKGRGRLDFFRGAGANPANCL